MKKDYLLYRVLLLFGLAGLLLTGCEKKDDSGIDRPKVVVVKVRDEKMKESTNIVGEIVAKDKVYLKARVNGFLEKRKFKEGAFIKKDDLLFKIEKIKYEAEVESARAQLETAEANLKNTLIDYDRQKYLVNKDAIAKKNYDLAECEKAKAEAEVLAGKARLKDAKLQLSYTDIYAPFSGKIGKSKYSVGSLVGLPSDSLALLTKLDPITAEFNISESLFITLMQYAVKENGTGSKAEKGKIRKDHVTIKLILANGTDYHIEGNVDFVDNSINPMTGTILVRAEFRNPNYLLTPGAYVNVIVESKQKNKCLLIPQAAVQEDQTGKFVMMVNKKNKVVRKTIKVGSIYGTEIIVLEGLKLGDHVIKKGLQRVRGGMLVESVKDSIIKSHTVAIASSELNKKSNGNQTKKLETVKIDSNNEKIMLPEMSQIIKTLPKAEQGNVI
jgi:membrane fusion protein, multidrug efflux system